MSGIDSVSTTPATGGTLARQEKAKLRKVLGRYDLVLFTACAIVGLETVAAAAQPGAQAITWLVISLVLFLIPYGMLTAELGSAFPLEGGPYEWAKMALGRGPGAITAVLYWLCQPLWVGGLLTATAIAAISSFIVHGTLSTGTEIAVGLGFTWVTTGIAIVAFRYGKWGPNIGTFVKIAVVAMFTILVIAFLIQHGHPAGTSTATDLKPSVSGFVSTTAILVFLWTGFELSSSASEEMHNPRRDVPKMIVTAGILAAALYGLVILGIILVIPKARLSRVSGFSDAYTAVAQVFHSGPLDAIFALLVILTLVGSGAVWLQGADRTQAIAALDGAAPAWMGRFTSFGTPIAVNLTSGLIGSVACVLVLLVTRGSLASFFAVMLAVVTSTGALSYAFVFAALVALRHKYPHARRPYRVPGGMTSAWIAVIMTEAFVIVTAVTMLWPGAVNALFGQPYSVKASWGVSRASFETVTLGSFAAMIMLALVFWAIGERRRRTGELGIAIPATILSAEPAERDG